MSRLPDVTVIVPTHDVETWVDDCLTSIRTQEGVDLSIIVVDDHSTDGTREIEVAIGGNFPDALAAARARATRMGRRPRRRGRTFGRCLDDRPPK